MNKSLVKHTLAAILLASATFHTASAESPPVIDPPINYGIDSAERFPLADISNLPYAQDSRKNYAITLGGGKGVLIAPSWVLTASHVITWNHQKNPWRLNMRFSGRDGNQYRAKKVYRHKNKDLALIQLNTPILEGREPVLLLRDPIPKGKKVTIKKVTEGQRVWKNIPARGSRKENLYVSKGQRKGGAGTSGSPWLIESPRFGDVLIGITHGSGRAPQVAHAKAWIQDTVYNNSPEVLYWVSRKQALAAENNQTTKQKKSSTLITLP